MNTFPEYTIAGEPLSMTKLTALHWLCYQAVEEGRLESFIKEQDIHPFNQARILKALIDLEGLELVEEKTNRLGFPDWQAEEGVSSKKSDEEPLVEKKEAVLSSVEKQGTPELVLKKKEAPTLISPKPESSKVEEPKKEEDQRQPVPVPEIESKSKPAEPDEKPKKTNDSEKESLEIGKKTETAAVASAKVSQEKEPKEPEDPCVETIDVKEINRKSRGGSVTLDF